MTPQLQDHLASLPIESELLGKCVEHRIRSSIPSPPISSTGDTGSSSERQTRVLPSAEVASRALLEHLPIVINATPRQQLPILLFLASSRMVRLWDRRREVERVTIFQAGRLSSLSFRSFEIDDRD